MRIVLTLAAGLVTGVAAWAAASPDVVGGATIEPTTAESSRSEDGTPEPGGRPRPDVLAAPPSRMRRVALDRATGPTSEPSTLPPGLGGPAFDAKLVEFGAVDLGVVITNFRPVLLDADYDVEIAPASAVEPSLPPGTERRGYDGSRCPEFNFDDRDRSSYDAEVTEDAPVYCLRSGRYTEARPYATPSALRRIERLPSWTSSNIMGFEGTREDLDAWERSLDECTFAGGRDVTLEVLRLGDPLISLAGVGLLPPPVGASVAIPLATADALIRRAPGSSSVTLDVPEDRSVFAFVGQVCAYVADYDVEISQGPVSTAPIYRVAEAGLGVCARLDRRDDGLRVLLDTRWAADLPTFETFTTSLWGGANPPQVTIEIPKPREAASGFRAAVPLADGEAALVGLSHGAVLVLVPRGLVRDSTHVRTWTPVDLGSPPPVGPVRPPASETIEVEWARVDAVASGATRGAARFEHVGASGVAGSPTKPDTCFDAIDGLVVPGSAYIVPGPVLDRRRIDVVVRPSQPRDAGARSTLVQNQVGAKLVASTVELPCVSRVVIPLRFLLRDGETGVRDVTVDRGDGPEAWRVTVSRRVARDP